MKKILSLLMIISLLTVFCLTSCDQESSSGSEPSNNNNTERISVQSISIDPSGDIEMTVGQTIKFTVSYFPANANTGLTPEFDLTGDLSSVTFEALTQTVTAVKPGTLKIKVMLESDNNIAVEVRITVKENSSGDSSSSADNGGNAGDSNSSADNGGNAGDNSSSADNGGNAGDSSSSADNGGNAGDSNSSADNGGNAGDSSSSADNGGNAGDSSSSADNGGNAGDSSSSADNGGGVQMADHTTLNVKVNMSDLTIDTIIGCEVHWGLGNYETKKVSNPNNPFDGKKTILKKNMTIVKDQTDPDHKAVITFKIEEDEFSDPFEQFPPYFYIRFIDDKRDGAGNMLEPYQESAPYPEKTVHDIEVNINSIMGDITVGLGG